MAPTESKQFLQKECVNIESIGKKTNGTNSSWILYLSAFSADLLLMFMGSIMVWSSSVIPKLMSNNTVINPLGRPITSLETSCIVSLAPFSSIFGFAIASIPADIIGRRRSLFYSAIFLFCCISSIAFAKNIYIYYLCFLCFGIFGAGPLITVFVYNTEIADNKNRAWLSCCASLGLPFGQLYGFVLGAMIDSIKIFSLLFTIPLIIHIILYNFTVESPIYLKMKNKESLALSTLKKLRTYDNFTDIEKEYKALDESSSNHISKKIKFINLFETKKSRKAFFISFLLIYTQQISGINIFLAYLGVMFKEAGTNLSGNEVGIIAGFVNFTTVLILIFIINRFGRRPLLLISSLFCSISLSSIAFYFYMKETESFYVDYIRWLPVFSIIIFIISFGLGLGSIPSGYIGELFPNELRSTGVSTVLIISAVICSSFDFVFPLLSEAFGLSFSLFLYSVLTLLGFAILYFCLPETRGMSFKEIQLLLETKIFNLP